MVRRTSALLTNEICKRPGIIVEAGVRTVTVLWISGSKTLPLKKNLEVVSESR